MRGFIREWEQYVVAVALYPTGKNMDPTQLSHEQHEKMTELHHTIQSEADLADFKPVGYIDVEPGQELQHEQQGHIKHDGK